MLESWLHLLDVPSCGWHSVILACFLSCKQKGKQAEIIKYPGGSDGKESACNAGDLDLIPELRRSPGGGHGNLLQYLAWRIPMDRGVWWATVHEVIKSWT